MADSSAEERMERRKRRILDNSESRMNKILGREPSQNDVDANNLDCGDCDADKLQSKPDQADCVDGRLVAKKRPIISPRMRTLFTCVLAIVMLAMKLLCKTCCLSVSRYLYFILLEITFYALDEQEPAEPNIITAMLALSGLSTAHINKMVLWFNLLRGIVTDLSTFSFTFFIGNLAASYFD